MTHSPTIATKTFWASQLFTRIWDDHPLHLQALSELFYQIEGKSKSAIESGVAPKAKAGMGLYESDFDLFTTEHTSLNALKQFIIETLQFVVSVVNGRAVEPSRIEVELIDSWFHITRNGGFHDAHFHSACSWCGIYYLVMGNMSREPSVGAPNGLNRFYSPINSGGGYRDYGNKYLEQSVVDVPAREGMLLIFPSFLLHSGLPYFGQQERIVVSFNSRSLLKS
jgi:uncharacterized protein (TIGR02466 family)